MKIFIIIYLIILAISWILRKIIYWDDPSLGLYASLLFIFGLFWPIILVIYILILLADVIGWILSKIERNEA